MRRYYPIHLYKNGKFKGYQIQKNLADGKHRVIALIFQRQWVKRILKVLNMEKGV